MRIEPRTRLTALQCVALLDAQEGLCPLCEREIVPGEPTRDEHLRALGLAGTNDLGNRAIVHARCADVKTRGPDGDLARIARAKRQRAATFGFTAGRSRRPMSCGKSSPFKRLIGGGVADRVTGERL
ncbi:hypothetical protein MMSR116_06005 [Methylobacterium mesophilicum SR1.6/6]|uniref:HNH endonuclease n=1 Tax=Methylobacterium mesophilicum SR1.6/6 TaxID=908290 RepID=A0A6B9FFZ9_9HYPH|nr:hypothetical protein [Methylobacterium mesophilicum]QGY01507.1 hypothetical protein MMSR116_06005 [Methylobacterium mesophilicum SR1.6/6]